MLYNKSDCDKCNKCGESYYIYKDCPNCERLEKLKGIKCPCCKSVDIDIMQQRESNNIIGPGSRSWVVSENFVCNDCGVLFVKPPKKRKKGS